LFNDQDVASDVHVILSGRIKVVTETLVGRPVLLALRGQGDLVGEMAAFDGDRRSATAIALEDTVTLALTVEHFQRLLQAHPEAALHLLRLTSLRLRDADRKRVEFTALDSAGRVATRLAELAERWGEHTEEGLRIDLGLTQDEIASWTGASREALTRALATFRERGWISTDRRRVVVHDLEALRQRGR
jgi:CRP-like cAMP-binding protein